MLIRLEPWEYAHANSVGIARFVNNWGTADAPYYVRDKMQDDRTAQVAAAVCELAVAKYLNVYWSGSVWQRKDHGKHALKADVGTNIEVRRVRTNKAAVRRKQLNLGLYLWVARCTNDELNEVDLLGWLPYDKAWEIGEPSLYDEHDSTRLVPFEALKKPAERP